MEITTSSDQHHFIRLSKRFIQYSLVGFSTFLFDLLLVAIFIFFLELHSPLAVGIGFIVAVHLNYLISRYWVFKGTKKKNVHTYPLFLALAIFGAFSIVLLVTFLTTTFDMSTLAARILVAIFIGCINFTLNTFVNFKYL